MLLVVMKLLVAQEWNNESTWKFLVKLRKTSTECFKLLKEVYGEDVMSRTQIFKWHKRFENACEEVENDPKKG